MAPLIILVNADARVLSQMSSGLTDRGYSVAAVRSFADGKALLASSSPDLLVVDVRLAEYNGLQLAIFSREDQPDLPVIVTNYSEDKIVEADAVRYGATFIADPEHNAAFLSRCRVYWRRGRRPNAEAGTGIAASSRTSSKCTPPMRAHKFST